MTYDLGLFLARVPLEISVPFALAAGILASTLGTWIINSIFAANQLEPNNNVGGIKFQFFGEIYAVTLALALIGAFDHYTSAQDIVLQEASTLAALDKAAEIYDQPGQDAARAAMKSSVQEYARAVVEKEWRTMSFGIPSFEVTLRFDNMSDAFLSVDPITGAQQALQQNTVDWVRQINEFRNFRLTTVSRSLIALVWIIMLIGTLIAIVFPWFFGTPNVVSQGLMSAILVSFLMLHLLVIVQLAYPFVGETSVSPAAFIAVAQ